jgi:acyl-Coa thioesterase superfamily protein/acyl-CoA thioesterase superfamily protein
MPEAFYERDGDELVATVLTRGPWDERAQHAGPPSAVLARAVEAQLPEGFRLARLSVDILRPVPIGRVLPRVTVRAGRRVVRVAAVLEVEGTVVMSGTALAQVVTDLDVPARPDGAMAGPEEGRVTPFFPVPWDEGYHTAVESRFVEGGWTDLGPARVWLRQRVPLLAGETPSPFQRAALVADCGNGVSAAVDLAHFSFVNADLSVQLHRDPTGEWIGLDAHTVVEPTGAGLAASVVHDTQGPVGTGSQSLLIAAW